MKISSNELRAMILEELKAVRGETLTENEEVVEVGGHGSSRGRAAADENFDQAVQTLIDLLGVTRDRAITAVQSLRGGASAGDHWTANLNQGSPDARLRGEGDAMSGAPDAPEGQEDLDETNCASENEEVEEGEVPAEEGEEVVEGLSLADEMEGHIDSAREEEGLQTVQESFSGRRLARLAGILED